MAITLKEKIQQARNSVAPNFSAPQLSAIEVQVSLLQSIAKDIAVIRVILEHTVDEAGVKSGNISKEG